MFKKLITFLLLSYALSVNAAVNEVPAPAQNIQPVPAGMQLAIDMSGQEDNDVLDADEAEELDLSDEHITEETKPGSASTSSRAYQDLVRIMPQLGYSADKTNKSDASGSAEQQNKLDAAVMKFASMPRMRSSIVLIYDENGQQSLHSKNADVVAPIASITKLMTAMVVLDAKLALDEEISISPLDISREKRSRSRTRVGMTLTRGELLKLALMASDNLSAAALARTYPGGTAAALAQMNAKARELGMNASRFKDPTGLSSGNVSTANDLVKMVRAAKGYDLIHQFSTSTSHTFEQAGHRPLRFHNTNPLVKNASWDIGLSKTGYISEAGRCLVMEAKITEHPVIIVLLDSWGRNSRVADANRVKKWMENASVRGRVSKSM
jgi:D-alanyl-D-alanine endopeptidase (penicillin-binding protein 7)